MKRCSSAVWQFFERIQENNRCVAVLCKLCENQYKYFGNTTNLRSHLTTKHPIQWELSQNGSLETVNFRVEDDKGEQSTPAKRKSLRTKKNVRYSISIDKRQEYEGDVPKINIQRLEIIDPSDAEDSIATVNLVKQMHNRSSGEEWLEDDSYQVTHYETYEPGPKRKNKMKYRKVKREIESPTGLPGYYIPPKADRTIVFEETPKNDEYSVFGQYVANKLRKFSAAKTRGNLQQLITTILWQAEYGMYDNAESVKRVLMYSVQIPEPEPSTADYVTEVQIENDTDNLERHTEEPNQSVDSDTLEVICTE